MAISHRVLTLVVAVVVALLVATPVQTKSVESSTNSSVVNRIIPGFGKSSFLDLAKWFEGISSFFPRPRITSFPTIEHVDGKKVWKFTIDVEGFKPANLNATRRGLALQVIGLEANDRNQTREIVYQQTLPLNGDLGKLSAVMKDHKLTITVPLVEAKVVKIPIRIETDLRYKPTVHKN